jgi:hypothetical protein
MGSGLNTEFIFGVSRGGDELVPEAAVFYAHWIGTVPWLWLGAGLTRDAAPGANPGRAFAAPTRTWAFAGLGAGLAGIAGIVVSSGLDAVYNPETTGDPAKIVDRLGEQVPQLIAFHTAFTFCSALLVVFAVGLFRRLAAQAPAGSLIPGVAAGGLGLTAVATLMGSGLNTEFIFGVSRGGDELVPEAAVFYAHWIGTVPWLWLGAGLTGLAVGIAALRHAAAPRWLGWVSVVLGGLTTLFGLSPLQYMAGFVGPVWVTVAALGFAFGDRAVRARTTA